MKDPENLLANFFESNHCLFTLGTDNDSCFKGLIKNLIISETGLSMEELRIINESFLERFKDNYIPLEYDHVSYPLLSLY